MLAIYRTAQSWTLKMTSDLEFLAYELWPQDDVYRDAGFFDLVALQRILLAPPPVTDGSWEITEQRPPWAT